eukprot:TRINITY_DN1079_c0_g1_i1.p1 TRINITY_DN1079_c0_g1~~TRINITY_DN1079_c0_g1_i1.p1  ORF type:complete len:1136 (-),score=356.31 TRINITY_DN1079_c0_g1_i1:94-3501(-)
MSEDTFSSEDQQLVQAFANSKGDKFSFMGLVDVIAKKGSEKKILCIGNYRLYLLKVAKKKVETGGDVNFLALGKIRSPNNSEVAFDCKTFSATIKSPKADEIITCIRNNIHACFPNGTPEETPISWDVAPSSRLRDLDPADRPCGNLANAYLAFCDYFGTPARQDIAWDIENLFPATKIKTFNLKEFELPLATSDIRALCWALKTNNFFTDFVLRGYKLEKDQFQPIVDCFKENKKIESLTLVGVNGTKDNFTDLAAALTANKGSAINTIDFSNNMLDDKGLTSVSSWLSSLNHGLSSINIADCGAKKQGMQAFGNALKKNVHMASTLTTLNISGNKLEIDGTNSMISYLANPNPLAKFYMKNTSPSLDVMIGAIHRGCAYELKELDIADNKMVKKDLSALTKLITSGGGLNKLNLAGCKVPLDGLREFMKTLFSNVYLQNFDLNLANNDLGLEGARALIALAAESANLVTLDLSENDFGDEGINILAEGLCHSPSLKKLILNRNFKEKGTKARSQAIESIIRLISSQCPIESLHIAGGRGFHAGPDLIPLIDAIGTNDSILSLDIAGNNLGNRGAMAMSKALQTNTTLTSLYWDENGTTLQGFRNFRLGLERNHTLKQAPLPILDMNNALNQAKEETEKRKITKVIGEIEQLIISNHLPKSKFTQKTEASLGSQFQFYSASQREEIEKHVMKIKATGKAKLEDLVMMKDASNYESVVAALHAAKAEAFEILGTELTQKLKSMVKDVEPIVANHYSSLKTKLAEIVKEKQPSLDDDTIKRLRTNINFGSKEIDNQMFEDILVRAAGGEIGNKSDECFGDAVDIAADYLFEKTMDSLENIIGEIALGSKRESAVTEDEDSSESNTTSTTTSHNEPTTPTPREEKPPTPSPRPVSEDKPTTPNWAPGLGAMNLVSNIAKAAGNTSGSFDSEGENKPTPGPGPAVPPKVPPKVAPRKMPPKVPGGPGASPGPNPGGPGPSSPSGPTGAGPAPGGIKKIAVMPGLMPPKMGFPPPRVASPSNAPQAQAPPSPTANPTPSPKPEDKKKPDDKKKDDKKTDKKSSSSSKPKKAPVAAPRRETVTIDTSLPPANLNTLPEVKSAELSHPTMERARIQKRRRPPTRRPRPTGLGNGDDQADDE